MRRTLIILAVLSLLAGCKTPGDPTVRETLPETGSTPQAARPELGPVDAILGAAENPEGVNGIFRMEVRNAVRQGEWVYLSSEADPRDQRSLTVAIPAPVAAEIGQRYGGDIVENIKWRKILVSGTAKRATIWIFANGIRTESYYYQTQVLVTDPAQVAMPGIETASGDEAMLAFPQTLNDPRGIQYVDWVPTPTQLKAQLEEDGWREVAVVRTLPDYLHGPIRAVGLHDPRRGLFDTSNSTVPPQDYGTITFDRIHYLNLEFGADGFVTAPIDYPDGRRAITFHAAVKQHYIMIIWDPLQRSGYVWRSFIYSLDGRPTEMRFLIQRQDLERI